MGCRSSSGRLALRPGPRQREGGGLPRAAQRRTAPWVRQRRSVPRQRQARPGHTQGDPTVRERKVARLGLLGLRAAGRRALARRDARPIAFKPRRAAALNEAVSGRAGEPPVRDAAPVAPRRTAHPAPGEQVRPGPGAAAGGSPSSRGPMPVQQPRLPLPASPLQWSPGSARHLGLCPSRGAIAPYGGGCADSPLSRDDDGENGHTAEWVFEPAPTRPVQ